MSDQPFSTRTNDRRVVGWLLIGLVVLFGGLYVAAYVFAGDRVPRDTTVSGVEVGGLRPAAARVRLGDELEQRMRAPITIEALDEQSELDPTSAGLDVDLAASIAQAGGGRSWHPARIWDSLTGGDDFDAVVLVDEEELSAAVGSFADKADLPAKDGRVVFKGEDARPRKPRSGEVVDREEAVRQVREAYLRDDTVAATTTIVQPEISQEDVSAAMDDFANPALSGPVTLVVGSQRVSVRPRDFGPALRLVAKDGELVPKLRPKVLVRRLEPRMETVPVAARDATVRIVGGHVDGRPRVVKARKGRTFDPQEVVDGFLDVVVQDGPGRTFRVGTRVARPDFTTREARDLRIVEEVSEFTTYFPHSDYRNTNLGRAAELIDGTVLKPGDTFSLNGIVGERTAENGFVKGFIISDGVYKEDYGGGVSQVATTTFNAMFFAGLEDVEHSPHSFYISRYPIGREATVAWPYVDLAFRNDSEHGVLVEAWITPSSPSSSGSMNVRMWSTKTWDIRSSTSERYNQTKERTRRLTGDDCVPNDGYGGFDIDVFRKFYRPGSNELDHRETFHTTYTPSDTVICEDS